MKMDVCQNSPIIIHSDDDDDDDDVVLVKAEKAPEDAKKRDEDDVIFISEEPFASVHKCTLKNQKNKLRLTRRSSSNSASDDDSSCSIPQIKYFRSEFSSVSLVDDILRPLDLSQSTVQTTDVLPAVITHKLSLLKPLQAACSSAVFQEQGENHPEKAVDDIELNPVKIIHDFGISSVKSIEGTSFTGRSARVDRFAPLKLPEGTDPLSSQTLNTPMCKIDPGKECFSLCTQEDTDANQSTSQLSDASATSSLACTNKTISPNEKQIVSANFFTGSGKWDSPQGKQIIGAYESSTNLAQDMDIISDDRVTGFTSDLLAPLPAAPGELGKTDTSELDQTLGTSELDQVLDTASGDVNSDSSHCSDLMPTNSFLSEVSPQPGTSKQLSNLDSSNSSQLLPETAKLHVPKGKSSLTNNGSTLTLDFNNLSTEDFSSLLDFFSDESDSAPLDDPKPEAKHSDVSAAAQSAKESDKTSEQTNSICVVNTDLDSSAVSPLVSHSSAVNCPTQSVPLQDCNNSPSSSRHFIASSSQTGCKKTLETSSIPSASPSKQQGNIDVKKHLKTLKDQLSAIEHKYSSYLLNHKKFPSQPARCLSSRQLILDRLSAKWKNYKYLITRINRRYPGNHSSGESGSLIEQHPGQAVITSSSKDVNAKVEKTDPAQWQIVSLEPRDKKSRLRDSSLNDELLQAKRRKVLQNSAEEKPGLKMRLKFSPVTVGQTDHSELLAHIQPSNIGLKKSIIRRHASMTGDSLAKGGQSNAGMHRCLSENGLKKHKTEENGNQILCVTCKKTVTSTKLSKCSKGHAVCATCLESQVKSILTGDIKQKNIRCPAGACIEILSFDELKRALPSFVVDILEEKLDKEYLSYITKWMFTDEQLKSRSEFATSDTRMPPYPALSMRKYEEIYTQESRDPTEDLPTFWTPMERGAPVMVFEVVPDTEEYRALAFQFHETLNFGDFDIVRIIRVQNPILWKYFALKRSEMVQENDGMDVTEKQLYHGTHRSTLEAIARKGFDWRLSGKHGTVYGCGSYFAKTSRYSHGYTDRAGNGVSVKSGSGPGRIIQPSLGLASLGMGFASLTSYQNRIHTRVQTLFNLSQTPMMPLLPPMITSQSQPPQPPPAHYHLPAPPPAHGQMSSLQVPAHNQTSNPVANKGTTISGSTVSQCGAATSNPPFVNILPVASTSSTVPGPSAVRFITNSNNYPSLNSSKPLFSDQLCNFQSTSQSSFSNLDTLFTSGPLYPKVSVSFQTQPSISGSRSACSSSSGAKLGPSSGNTYSVGDMLGTSSNHVQTKHGLMGSSGAKAQGESKHCSSSTSTQLRDHERGTADLTASFARDNNSETHFMFVARVLVGRHTGGKAGLKRPPPLDENNPFGKSYDSCVDDIFYPQVFVIFDSNQAYPEYVIEYNWHKD